MTIIAAALIVTAARKTAAQAAIADLTPDYTVGFSRQCCAIGPGVTWETPATHWYANGSAVDSAYVQAWQDAVDAAGPSDPLNGLIIFTAQNAANAYAWALTNLESQGLQFVPDEP